jgi:hypothetical protein
MSIGKQSSNKWTPKEDDKEGQVMMLSLAQTSDLNFLTQQLNLFKYSQDSRNEFEKLLEREYIKRRYFLSYPPTYALKKAIDELPTELDEADKELYNEQQQKEKVEELKKHKEKALKDFEDLNKELKSLGLPEII